MKRVILASIFLISVVNLYSQEIAGFQPLTFEQALKKADAEKKLVFVECFTSRFDLGRDLITNVFSKKEFVDFFRTNFISIRVDMAQKVGNEIKKKLNVKQSPSYFIIRSDGTVQHLMAGLSNTPLIFVERVKKGLNEQTSYLYLNRLYDSGKMNKNQMLAYKEVLSGAMDEVEASKVAEKLDRMLTNDDKLKREFWPIFQEKFSAVGSANFNLLLANLSLFEKNQGKEALDEYLLKSYDRVILNFIRNKADNELITVEELKRQVMVLTIPQRDQLVAKAELAGFVQHANVDGLLSYMEDKATELTGMDALTAFMAFRSMTDKATKDHYKRVVDVLKKLITNPKNVGMVDQMQLAVLHYQNLTYVGTHFEDLSFDQALKLIRKTGKKLFIYCYVSDCDSCSYMSDRILNTERVGDYLNERFICVKYDLSKDSGAALKNEYRVRQFPTFVTLDSDGVLCHKFVGCAKNDTDFIENVKTSFDDNAAFGSLEKKFKKGNDKNLTVRYIDALNAVGDIDMVNVVSVSLYRSLTAEEKQSDKYWFLFCGGERSYSNEARKYVLDHRAEFNRQRGVAAVDRVLSGGIRNKLKHIFRSEDLGYTVSDIDQMKHELELLNLSNEKSILVQLDIAQAVMDKKISRVLNICEQNETLLPIEDFPFALQSFMKERANSGQMQRWDQLCKRKSIIPAK